MTEEERREMTRSNYAAQMEMLGYDVSGNPLDMVHVVRCKDCAHCFSLAAVDPMRPYEGGGDGSFYCSAFDMDFYAPHYDAATYYCADGERRTDDGPSD